MTGQRQTAQQRSLASVRERYTTFQEALLQFDSVPRLKTKRHMTLSQ